MAILRVRLRMFMVCSMAVGASICSCKEPSAPKGVKQSREVMGTLAEVTAVASDQKTARAAVEAAYARLEDVNRLMSDYRDDSEIGQLNLLPAGQGFVVSPETFDVLQQAHAIAEATGGVFDVTCRPLVERWKQAGKEQRVPDEASLAEAMTRVGWRKLRLESATRTVTKTVANMQIDVGGIAKGYSLDLAGAALVEAGASGGLIDVGGDVLAVGRSANGGTWRVGIQHPFQPGLIAKLAVVDRAVATSGIQQRFTMIQGKRYSHIIDPRTGGPADQAPSVTVIAADGITADAWATVFEILTVEEGQARAAELDGVEVMWIWGNAEQMHVAKTSGFDRYVIP